MTPGELVAALLAASDAQARQALLTPQERDYYVQVVRQLKDEADKRRLQDPRVALAIADVALEVADFTALPECRALAGWARGNVLIHLGEYEETLRLYRQAAEFYEGVGAGQEAARLMANRASALRNLGRYEEGRQVAQSALAILRHYPPSVFLASVLTSLGALCRAMRRSDEALAAYAESEALYAQLGEEIRRARVVINRANVFENLDRFDEALALLVEARAILDDHGQSLEVARADLNLGILHTRLGHYNQAIDALDRAERQFGVLGDDMEVAVVALYRADLYAEFNLHEDLLRESISTGQVFEEREMQWQAARVMLYQAVAWRRLGNAVQASELLDRAEAAFARIGDPLWVQLARLERASLWYELGDMAQALPVAVETASFLQGRGMVLRAAGSALLAAQCYLALDRLTEATSAYQEVLDAAQALDVPSLLCRVQHGFGLAANKQGRLDQALDHFRQAAETVEEARRQLRVEDYRLGFLEDKLRIYQDAVLLCIKTGRTEEALAFVERAKSGALVEVLLGHLASSPSLQDEGDRDILERLDTIRDRLNWQRHEPGNAEIERTDRTRAIPEGELWQHIVEIESQAAHTWREMQQSTSFYPAFVRPELLEAGAIPSHLGPNEVLLQYYMAGDSIVLFVIGPDGLRGCFPVACTRSQAEQSASALDTILQSAASLSPEYVEGVLEPLCRRELGWLYDDLLRPFMPAFETAERLLIAPDGILFDLPFHALHDGERYLIERYEVAYVPSASTLGLCRENRARHSSEPGRALVVGYSPPDTLRCLQDEVKSVARVLPQSAILLDEEATIARLRELAGESRVLHLATHAAFRRDNPLFSALQLAGGDWLRVMDLYSLHLHGALVTVSGCETGRHRLLGGDLVGLGRGFFIAGASALVASLWPVSDAPGAILMEQFYSNLAAGETAVASLRRAQQAVLAIEEERDGRWVRSYTHPFYWAPFCLIGAPEFSLQGPMDGTIPAS